MTVLTAGLSCNSPYSATQFMVIGWTRTERHSALDATVLRDGIFLDQKAQFRSTASIRAEEPLTGKRRNLGTSNTRAAKNTPRYIFHRHDKASPRSRLFPVMSDASTLSPTHSPSVPDRAHTRARGMAPCTGRDRKPSASRDQYSPQELGAWSLDRFLREIASCAAPHPQSSHSSILRRTLRSTTLAVHRRWIAARPPQRTGQLR